MARKKHLKKPDPELDDIKKVSNKENSLSRNRKGKSQAITHSVPKNRKGAVSSRKSLKEHNRHPTRRPGNTKKTKKNLTKSKKPKGAVPLLSVRWGNKKIDIIEFLKLLTAIVILLTTVAGAIVTIVNLLTPEAPPTPPPAAPSDTPTPLPSNTIAASLTATNEPTSTITATYTLQPTPTSPVFATPQPTKQPRKRPTDTPEPSLTAETPTFTQTVTSTATATRTHQSTLSPSPTNTFLPTFTFTHTFTPIVPTPTATSTPPEVTSTFSPTITSTPEEIEYLLLIETDARCKGWTVEATVKPNGAKITFDPAESGKWKGKRSVTVVVTAEWANGIVKTEEVQIEKPRGCDEDD